MPMATTTIPPIFGKLAVWIIDERDPSLAAVVGYLDPSDWGNNTGWDVQDDVVEVLPMGRDFPIENWSRSRFRANPSQQKWFLPQVDSGPDGSGGTLTIVGSETADLLLTIRQRKTRVILQTPRGMCIFASFRQFHQEEVSGGHSSVSFSLREQGDASSSPALAGIPGTGG